LGVKKKKKRGREYGQRKSPREFTGSYRKGPPFFKTTGDSIKEFGKKKKGSIRRKKIAKG